jgi:hypothetical protein
MNMILEVEKTPVAEKSFAKIEKELRALKSYGPHSFASLNKPDDSFVQVAGGRVTCVLEMREMPSEKLWRAYMDEPRVPFEGLQSPRPEPRPPPGCPSGLFRDHAPVIAGSWA